MKNSMMFAGALALALMGCGGSSTSLFTSEANAESAAIAAVCECYAAVGQPDAATCVTEFTDANTAEQDACIKAIVDANTDALRPAANCRIGVFNAAHDCINQVVACDEAAINACTDAVDLSLMDCPDVPTDIETQIVACFN